MKALTRNLQIKEPTVVHVVGALISLSGDWTQETHLQASPLIPLLLFLKKCGPSPSYPAWLCPHPRVRTAESAAPDWTAASGCQRSSCGPPSEREPPPSAPASDAPPGPGKRQGRRKEERAEGGERRRKYMKMNFVCKTKCGTWLQWTQPVNLCVLNTNHIYYIIADLLLKPDHRLWDWPPGLKTTFSVIPFPHHIKINLQRCEFSLRLIILKSELWSLPWCFCQKP